MTRPAFRPRWRPLSVVLFDEPRSFASPALVRRMLPRRGELAMVYCGDRMWPALRSGQRFVARAQPPAEAGAAVLVEVDGFVDAMRVARIDGERLFVAGDADPSAPFPLAREACLATLALDPAFPAARGRLWRRVALDLLEAAYLGDPLHGPGAASIARKYLEQAPAYLMRPFSPLPPEPAQAVARHVRPAGRVLVAGCGAGNEAVALARAGFSVKATDIVAPMIDGLRQAASAAGVRLECAVADLLTQDEPRGQFDAVMFTPQLYAMIAQRSARVAMMRRVRAWTTPHGVAILPVKREVRPWDRGLLTLERLVAGGAWGDSHTRFPRADGSVGRAYIHAFTPRSFRAEVCAAGWRVSDEIGAVAVLSGARA